MVNRSCVAAVLVLAAACSDRALTPPDQRADAPQAVGPSGRPADPPVELAKMVAKGLKNPAFRAYLSRWEDVIGRLASAGVRAYVEVGPGTVLSGLVRKIQRDARVASLETPADLEAVERLVQEVQA